MKWRQLGTVLAMVALTACQSTDNTQVDSTQADTTQADTTLTDQAELAEAPDDEIATVTAERVVALTSLSADLIANLDVEKLIGIPGSPILNQDPRFADIPTVSEGRTEPDLEKIINLDPDLVIGAKGFHDKALQRLESLGVGVMSVNVDSWENLRSFTEAIATSIQADAQPLLDRYDACLSQPPTDSPSALVLVSRQPILAPNKNSWAGDFLDQFNIQNLAAELQGQSAFDGYITLSAEKVIEADPDIILVVDTGEDLLGQLKTEPFWSQLTATQEERVLAFDYFGLVNPGSVASVEKVCQQLKS
ncbi:MAG: ABC transporter substrate-binding protein [Cyanobacteria bacterium P01_D01_bin.1]